MRKPLKHAPYQSDVRIHSGGGGINLIIHMDINTNMSLPSDTDHARDNGFM